MLEDAGGWVNYAKNINNTDEELIKFLTDVDSGKRNIKDIDDYMDSTSKSANKFSSSLANIAANIGIMLAINVAIQVATKLWDEFNTTVEEAQADLDETQSVIADLETQIKELESIDANALTQGQKDKLENLKEQLEVQKQLEEIEKRRVAQEKLGTGNWSDQFDEGSYAKAKKEMEKAKSDYEVDARDFAPYQQAVENLKYWSDLYEKEKNESGSTDYGLDTIEYQLEKSRQSVELYTEDIGGMYNSLLSQKADIQEWSTFLQDGIENGLFVGEDLEYANAELERLSGELTWVEEQMKYINELLYGGDDSIENTIAEKTKYSYQNLIDNEFSEEDLQLLATLTFDKNASITELREILAEAKKTTDDFADGAGISTILENLNSEVSSYEDAYSKLASAQEEYLEAGSLSADTFIDLQESGLLEYLEFTSEGLTVNKDKLLENAQASKDKAVADLHAAMMSDMLQIALGNVDNVSEQAQSVIAQLGDNTEIAGQQALSSVANWATLGDTIATVMAQAKGEDPTNVISDAQKQQMSAVYDYYKNLAKSVSAIDISTKTRTSASNSSSTTDFKDILDKYLNLYEAELDAGIISFDDFLSKSRSMLDQYYREGKISAADYWGYIEDLYKQQLSIYDKAISGMTYILDKEIESLEKEKEAIEDSYQTKIDAIQSEIDSLEEVNNKRKEQMELEQAQYNLRKALNQRTKKVLTDDRGFIYTEDNEAIRDAKNELADLEHSLKVSQLEAKIESLEKAMESEINTIDKEIDKYEEYKKQLQDVTEAYENAENVKYALAVTGLNSETEILQCRTDVLNNFANNYIATQQAMADAAVQSANTQIQAINAVTEAQRNNGGNTVTTTATENPSAITTIKKPSDDAFWYDTITKKSGSAATVSANISKNKYIAMKYGTGTENAKQGIHEVSEKGDEIILDNHGNALLAKGKQLHYFEGGETVIKSSETIEFLKNQGNMIPVQTWFDNLDTLKFMKNMPQYTPNISMPNYDFAKMNHNTGTTISIGDIHLHEVQNVDSFADAIIREFPNVVTQKIYK